MLSRIPKDWRAVVWLVLVPLTLACVALGTIGVVRSGGAEYRTGVPGALSVSQTLYVRSVPSHTTPAQARRHHLARVRATHRHHVAMVEAAHDRYVASVMLANSHGYGADWWTTNTTDWRCIRDHEEGMAQAPANMFGFVPYSGGMSAAAQSALALSILHTAGWAAWSTARWCGL